MQQALRSSALVSVAVLGAGLVAIAPMVTTPPDIHVHSSDVQLASADMAASGVADSIDAALNQLQSSIDQGVVALGFVEYGLLTQLATGFDDAGATALGADFTTLANDAIDTQLTTAPIAEFFNGLEAVVNELFPATAGASDAAASLADSTPTTLGGLIDSGLAELQSSIDQGIVSIGYVEYGLLSELATGLDDAGATSLGADVMTLANDAIDTQLTTAPIAELFNGLDTLVADLGLNSIPL